MHLASHQSNILTTVHHFGKLVKKLAVTEKEVTMAREKERKAFKLLLWQKEDVDWELEREKAYGLAFA